MVILIEKASQFHKVYYSDGHSELINHELIRYINKTEHKNRYKTPIVVGSDYLHPTQNKRDINCRWINLQCFDHNNEYCIKLLKSKNLFEKAKKEYIFQKTNQLTVV